MSDSSRSLPRLLNGPGAKALLVGVLILLFLIPLALLRGTVDERRAVRDEAEASVIDPAGGRPEIFGPYLSVPYDLVRNKEHVEGQILILARELDLVSSLKTEIRHRGIFSAPVFSATLRLSGVLQADAAGSAPSGAVLHWDRARVILELGDVRSLRETPRLVWNGEDRALITGAGRGTALDRFLVASPRILPGERCTFAADLPLRGGRSLLFLEPAGTVHATLAGDWPGPAFRGYLAPTDRSVGKEGFTAGWYLPESAQSLPTAFDSSSLSPDLGEKAAFGVDLLDGVDGYARTSRAVRYGILFVIVPFVVLFLFELLSRIRIHPVQYILIGLANCIFYLLLLSLSELVGFAWAYVIAATVCAGLAAVYTASILRSRRGLFMLPALGLLYGYLFVALQSEDYALLIGSIGLLLILAGVMAATRRIDWYGRRAVAETNGPVS